MGESGFVGTSDLEEAAGGYYGLYWGVVIDNADPQKMGRIRAHVHGLTTKETTWAFPIGMPGAGYFDPAALNTESGGKGGYYVPRKNATVLVGFIHGKFEEPVYLCGHYPRIGGACGVPRIVAQQSEEQAPNVRVIAETETFEIYILDTATEQKVVLQTLDKETSIEMDAKDGSIKLKALASIIIDAPAVQINGVNVTLKKRPVSPLGLAI